MEQKKGNLKTISIRNHKENAKEYSVTMNNHTFWIGVILICAIIGGTIGALFYEGMLLSQMAAKALEENAAYEELEGQFGALEDTHDTLIATNQELETQVALVRDTYNTLLAEIALEEEGRLAMQIPTGFPVAGTATEAVEDDLPEDANELEPALYLAGESGAIVVATGSGVVEKIVENAFDGYDLYVNHQNGYVSVFSCSVKPIIEQGRMVVEGTPMFILEEDNNILKYQITKDDALIDPYSVMKIEG